ncbi:MAG: hypothetical protein ACOYJB_06555 [Christensenellaceae bacterium]|jgi:hypothetical protein
MNVIQVVLTIVFVLLAVLLIRFTLINLKPRKVTDPNKPFFLRLSPFFLLLALIFFIAGAAIALMATIRQAFNAGSIVGIAIFLAMGLVLLLRSLISSIKVFPEYIVYTNAFSRKAKIAYSAIKEVLFDKRKMNIVTDAKTYTFSAMVLLRSEFIEKLRKMNVPVTLPVYEQTSASTEEENDDK